MKDIPIFTACNGIASLILNQIPYRGDGYVLIRSIFSNAQDFMQECEHFCRMAGAQRVYFSGEADFAGMQIHATLLEREILQKNLPDSTAQAVETTDPSEWISLYNENFRAVPAAKYCREAKNAYDILKDGKRIGIGQVVHDRILTVAALQRGAGADCVRALAKLCDGETVYLNCAKENLPAMRLYDRLGFSEGSVKEIWYCKKTLAI